MKSNRFSLIWFLFQQLDENLRNKLSLGRELLDTLANSLQYFGDLRLSIQSHIEQTQDTEKLIALGNSKKSATLHLQAQLKEAMDHFARFEKVGRRKVGDFYILQSRDIVMTGASRRRCITGGEETVFDLIKKGGER